MKRYLLYAVLISTVLFSCKKDNTTLVSTLQGDSKKYDIAFNVAGFSTSQAPFGAYAATRTKVTATAQTSTTVTTDSLSKHVGVIYCIITDSKGTVVSRFTQFVVDTAFGKIKASLAPGSYHVSVVAGPMRIPVNGKLLFSESLGFDSTLNQFTYSNASVSLTSFGGDVFMKMMDITVGNTTGNYNVTLDRIVAQVEVNIQDAIPANASYIKVTINNDHYILNADGTSQGNTGEVIAHFVQAWNFTKVINLTPGATNTKIYDFVLNTQSAMTVIIQCYDANDNVIAERTLTNVTAQPNHITLLTGNLFANPSNGGVGVSYNTAWNVQTLNYTF